MPQLTIQSLNGNEEGSYIKQKLKKTINDPRLYKLHNIIRELNRHDFDKAFLMTGSTTHPAWDQIHKDIVDKLVKIHMPTIYGKAVQIDKENLIELPAEDINRYPVISFDYHNDELYINDIYHLKELNPTDDILALVGRHPFKDTKGWTICHVKLNHHLHEVVGIGQQTWKERGGDFDGDSVMVLLIELPYNLYEQLKPKVTKSNYKTNEEIIIPKKAAKATTSITFNDLQIPDFKFKYCHNNRCLIYPESMSHVQNLEQVTGAVLMAINIATEFTVRWNKEKLTRNTDIIKQQIQKELQETKNKKVKKFMEKIHPSFYTLITPVMCIDNLDVELYQAVLRLFLKDKGPSIFGYIQKILLSVAKTDIEIEQALNFIDIKQQSIIDLKKAEHSLLNYNDALHAKAKKYLKESEVKNLYEKWETIDSNWSKKKGKLLFKGKENDELDTLVTIVPKICFE